MKPLSKLGLLGSLYLSQGLPYGFFIQALPVLMRKAGWSLEAISLSSLLALPWGAKFIWAPLVDRFYWRSVGRRRSWILPLQAITVLTLLALAGSDPGRSFQLLLGAVFLANLLAATQDIATDGLAVELLAPSERGVANGVQVAGYRVGMIIGGGALLIAFDQLGWPGTFLAMAAIIAVASIPVMMLREEQSIPAPAPDAPWVRHFLLRKGVGRVLLLVLSYKTGDSFGQGMLRPFLVDAGFELSDIGWMLGTVGFVAGMLGALTGGALVNRLGRRPALILFGLFQAATIFSYAWLAWTPGHPRSHFLALTAVEHFSSGTATASLFTAMMDWCLPSSSGSDYTVQASAVVIATGLGSALSGYSAAHLGHAGHFALGGVLTLFCLLPVVVAFPKGRPS